MVGRNLIIFLVIILVLVAGFVIFKQEANEKEIYIEEKKQIDVWIEENDLNQYGDPKDTVYMGGTPLFDEKTGQTLDKYEYILKNYPDRPWLK